MYKLKQSAANNWTAAKTIWGNFTELLNAACLTAVGGYAVYQSIRHRNAWYDALLFAGIVIALQALVLFLRHCNKTSN